MLKKVIVVFLSLSLLTPYLAADTMYPWDRGSNRVFVHFSDKNVRSILTNFCKLNSCKLNIDDNDGENNYLNRHVSGNFAFDSNTELLNFLSSKYGFSWFFYHGILYIGSTNFTLDVISIPPEYLQNLQDNLMAIGLFNPKFGWAVNSENSTIVISGPPTYNKLVVNFTKHFAPLPRGNNFAVIRLKYANAGDVNLNLNGVAYRIPGVSTIINNLTNPYIMEEYQGSFQYSPQSTVLLKNMLSSYKSDPNVQNILDTVDHAGGGGGAAAGGKGTGNDENSNQQVMTTFPIVQSDVRNNSVIIFDKNANLPMYEKLVHYLDIPQRMIQINTTIIDLDEDKLETAGVNWLATLGGAQVGFNGANVLPTSTSLSVNAAAAGTAGAPAQTLINAGSLQGLIANINYLSQNGAAKIQATPSIITLMELPAVLTFNTQLTFYQAGPNAVNPNTGSTANNSSPTQVNASSSIVITPHAVGDNKFRLEITLQAQQVFDQDNTSSYPILNGGTIQTQAVVSPGQGLILGGYDQDKQVKFVSKVPILGDIPVLGWFFKSEVIKTLHIKRAYLITINLINTN